MEPTSCCASITSRGPGEQPTTSERSTRVSSKGDLKKVRRRAEGQGWRVEKRKEYWLFFPLTRTSRRAGLPAHRHPRDRLRTFSRA
jgi:hypothetical protein